MQQYYNPDFRAPDYNQYQTVYNPEADKSRERDFVLRLQTQFGAANKPQVWLENNGSLVREDPYIDGYAEVGKLIRGFPDPNP